MNWIISALIGLIVTCFAGLHFYQIEKTQEETALLNTVNYVKVQCATYTLTIQSLLDGYQKSSDGTIIVADEGVIIASNDRSLIGQSSTEQEAIQQLKKNADSKHMMHLKAGDVFSYGIMLKQRDHYIYAYVPDTVIFQTLPQNVIACMFIYLVVLGVIWLAVSKSRAGNLKREQEKEEVKKIRSTDRSDASTISIIAMTANAPLKKYMLISCIFCDIVCLEKKISSNKDN